MSFNYTLKYRTFDQLMADVRTDFSTYSAEQLIEPQQLIRVVKKINYSLGLRINSTKETVIDIEDGRGRLPDDFYVINFALLCGQHKQCIIPSQGTHIEERKVVPEYTPMPEMTDQCTAPTVNCQLCLPCGQCDPCQTNQDCSNCQPKPRTFINCKGEEWELIQILHTQTVVYNTFFRIRIKQNANFVDSECPNIKWGCVDEASIKDGWIFTNFKCGKLYLNYQGQLVDDDGNLMVPDHDGMNDYYEYAVKDRILENLFIAGEDVERRIALIKTNLREARIAAQTIVNTPNFAEMKKTWQMNRKAQYSKYYSQFASYNWGYRNYNR